MRMAKAAPCNLSRDLISRRERRVIYLHRSLHTLRANVDASSRATGIRLRGEASFNVEQDQGGENERLISPDKMWFINSCKKCKQNSPY